MSAVNPLERITSGPSPLDLSLGAGAGRYLLRPRSVLIDQNPAKVLDSNRRRVGAYFYNGGGKLELPLDLGAGFRQGAALPLQQFIDSGGIQVPSYALSSFKTLVLIVDVQITKGAASQASLALIVGRGPWAPQAGNASQTGGDFQNVVKGAPVNIGANAATLGRGLFVVSPADIADLQWPHPWIGAELNAGGAITAGAARLFMSMPLGPAILLGMSEGMNANPGDTANSMLLPPQDAWQFIPTDRELWAMATPGGSGDLRIWELMRGTPERAASVRT